MHLVIARFDGVQLHEESALQLSGVVRDIIVDSGFAYVALGDRGLSIVDLTNISQPAEVAFFWTGDALGISLVKNLALVAAGHNGLFAVDVSSPALPHLAWVHQTLGYARGLQVVADIAHLLDTGTGVVAIRTLGRGAPEVLAEYVHESRPDAIEALGNLVYLTGFTDGLQIVDVTDPAAPVLLSRSVGHGWGLTIASGIAVIANANLDIIDVSDPHQPRYLAHVATPGSAMALSSTGSRVLVGFYGGGVATVDISDPEQPLTVARLVTGGVGGSIGTGNGLAAIAGSYGFSIFDISQAGRPVELSRFDGGSGISDVAIEDHLAVVADFNRGLHIIDLTNPEQPEPLGLITLPRVRAVDFQDSIAYLASVQDGFIIVDLADHNRPSVRSTLPLLDTRVYDVAVAHGLAFLGCGNNSIVIVDVSDPGNPIEISRIGDSNVPFAGGMSVAVSNGLVYSTTGSRGLSIIDVSDPAAPVLLSQTFDEGINAGGLSVSGDLAVVTGWNDGLWVFDVSDPSHPFLLDQLRVAGNASDVALVDSVVMLGQSSAGISMYDAESCIEGVPPQVFAWWPPTPTVGQRVDFSPAYHDALSYFWTFEDGTVSTAIQPNHRFSTTGPAIVRLTTDNGQQIVTTELSMQVQNPALRRGRGRVRP